MQSYRLTRMGSLLLALLAVFAFGAITAAAAQAENAPRWSIGGRDLGENETHYITAKIYTTKANPRFTLRAAGRTISCLAARLNPGVLLGSSATNPGTNDEVIEFYGNCTVEGNGSPCAVTEPIVTANVKSELVESEKGAKGSLLTEFFPEKGAEFVTLHFTGSGCTVATTAVSGSVAAQVLTDPKNGELGTLLTLESTQIEATSWLLNAPSSAITKVWLIKGGEGKTATVGLTAFSEPATLEGTALVLLAKKKNGVFESEEIDWSPLA